MINTQGTIDSSKLFETYINRLQTTDRIVVLNKEKYSYLPSDTIVFTLADVLTKEETDYNWLAVQFSECIEKCIGTNQLIALRKLFDAFDIPNNLSIKESIAYMQLLGN